MATVNLTLGTNKDGTIINQISGVILQPGDVIQFGVPAGSRVLADVTTTNAVEIEVGANPIPSSEIRASALADGTGYLITFANPGGGGTPPTGGGN